MLLKDKVAIITGAASGMGRETALLFAQEGAKVAIADVRDAPAEETARLVESAGGDAFFTHCDVTQEYQVRRLVETVVAQFGQLDVMHNNAGVPSPQPPHLTWQYTDDEYAALVNVNLKGVFFGCKYAMRAMLGRGGVIVNTASSAGLAAMGPPLYGMTKAAVIHLTKGLAVEAAPHGVRVNCVCPGAIDTEFGTRGLELAPDDAFGRKARLDALAPMGRMGEASEVARAILYLASDMSSYVTGTALTVDGGFTAR